MTKEFWAKIEKIGHIFFGPIFAEKNFLSCKVGIGSKLYFNFFFRLLMNFFVHSVILLSKARSGDFFEIVR